VNSKNLPLAGLLIIGTIIGASGSTAAASIQNSILGANTEIGLIDDIDGIQQQSIIAMAEPHKTDGIVRANRIDHISIIDESDISNIDQSDISIIDESDISNGSLIGSGRIIGAEIQGNQIDDDSIEIAA
jgi:hypothetical protein